VLTLAFLCRALFTGCSLWFCLELPGSKVKKNFSC
jgi:hypothetical protein